MVETTASGLGDERITMFGVFVEASRRLQRVFARTLRDEHGLSMADFEALLRVGRSPERRMSMTQLAEQMVLTSGGVTRLVDRLAKAGLVSRLQCDSDRRVQWASLTEEGGALVEAALSTHLADLEAHFVSALSEDEMRTLTEVCDRLRRDCS